MTPSFRLFTSSMNAGGNDHSRPTIRPIFRTIRSLLRVSIVTPDIPVQHLLPPGPIVRPAVPEAEGITDVPAPEDAGDLLVALPEGVVPAGDEDDVHPLQRGDPARVLLAHDEIDRVVEVDRLVVEAVGEAPDVIDAAHADHPPDRLGVAEGEVGGVVGP